jgi:hypothetical protein
VPGLKTSTFLPSNPAIQPMQDSRHHKIPTTPHLCNMQNNLVIPPEYAAQLLEKRGENHL